VSDKEFDLMMNLMLELLRLKKYDELERILKDSIEKSKE